MLQVAAERGPSSGQSNLGSGSMTRDPGLDLREGAISPREDDQTIRHIDLTQRAPGSNNNQSIGISRSLKGHPESDNLQRKQNSRRSRALWKTLEDLSEIASDLKVDSPLGQNIRGTI